jgi:hypothetical protein
LDSEKRKKTKNPHTDKNHPTTHRRKSFNTMGQQNSIEMTDYQDIDKAEAGTPTATYAKAPPVTANLYEETMPTLYSKSGSSESCGGIVWLK